MGATYSYLTDSTFIIYSRQKETDQYKALFEITEGNPLSRFKHEVYAYALQKNHTEEKSLYLYCGYSRVAKCIREIENEVPYVIIEFSAPEHAERWDTCREQIPNVLVDISWLQPQFSKHWVFQHEDNLAIRKYQNYRMDK